jgi:hypothetical protein
MKELEKNIKSTFEELYATISAFNDSQIDVVPFSGSWTPGQVAEHIIKSISGIPNLCDGSTKVSHRAADEKTEAIRKLFLDFTQKFQSPDFIVPIETQHNKANILHALKRTEGNFLNVARTHDLSLICLDFELFGFGHLTKLELLDFGLTHTQRHIRQLKNIFHHLTQNN